MGPRIMYLFLHLLLEVHLNTSRDVIIRVGEQLKLNCTIIGTKNLSNYQLSWYHGTQRLAHMTKKLSNTTIQLVIDHVAWNSNGTYACKGTGVNSVQPKDVLVRVGGELSLLIIIFPLVLRSANMLALLHHLCRLG